MKRAARMIGLAGGLLVAISAAAAPPRSVKLQLALPAKPPFPPPTMQALLTAGPLTLEVVDERGAGDPAVLGSAREKGEDLYLWRAEQPVAAAVQGMAAQLAAAWSVHVVPEAELGLRIGLTRYAVTEKSETFGSTYLADVALKLSYVDKAGGVLWSGEATGSAKRPGVDGRASMCNEALSMALRGALAQALSAVSLETAAAPGPSPTPAPRIAIEPEALLADLTRLKAGGVADEVLVAYVGQRKLTRALTVDEILQWKGAGLPDAAIKAATNP
jgi:hypothetical protein